MLSEADRQHIIEKKTAIIIEIIMQERGLSRAEAAKLWYNSRTKKETLDKKEYSFVSPSRCYDELEMEITGDSYWLLGSFE
ncbi:MAG: hypothetical protein HFG69_09700 [Hungatella sp.]|jgi:hypothetical protein|nr:hypothetical protein [Hungatella sp.]